MAKESSFQAKLIKELYDLFHGCFIMKNDANYIQGVPDLLILHNDRWAMLECKASKNAKTQPNQEYYINRLNIMSYCKKIYPENKEEVLNELQQTLQPRK